MEALLHCPPSSEGGLSIIEQVGRLAGLSGCNRANRPYMVALDLENDRAFIFRPDCKTWGCPSCAAHLRARWTLRAYLGVLHYQASGGDFKFVTLTSHERLHSFGQTLHVWPKAWSILRRRVSRAAPGWRFVMVPEQHRTGRLHVHLIASANLGSRWWKDNGREAGLGFIAEEAEFRAGAAEPALAAAYVAKYLGKQMAVAAWPRYFHHIRTSQRFPQIPNENGNPYDDLTWIAMNTKRVIGWLELQRHLGFKVFYTGSGEELTT